jgi:hypothetical protein
MTLTTHPHLVSRLIMRRSYTPLPQSTFMACSGTALAFICIWKTDTRVQEAHVGLHHIPSQKAATEKAEKFGG